MRLGVDAMLEGLGRVRHCSVEGRAGMSLDLGLVEKALRPLAPPLALSSLRLVDGYIKAFYLPWEELGRWAQVRGGRWWCTCGGRGQHAAWLCSCTSAPACCCTVHLVCGLRFPAWTLVSKRVPIVGGVTDPCCCRCMWRSTARKRSRRWWR